MQTERHPISGLLVLPRIRVQNANAISSPLTWGFPALTAFTGLMDALARRLGPDACISFHSVGVVCHDFEAQVSQEGYTRSFSLTRNPVLKDGSTAAIVEEGRVHLDITLVFNVGVSRALLDDTARKSCADQIAELLAGMRIAGGSVMPPLLGRTSKRPRAQLVLVPEDAELRAKQFRRLSRQWLPGFALVSRGDLLEKRLAELRESALADDPQPSLLDALLDLSRINHRASRTLVVNEETGENVEQVEWVTDSRPGWLAPIPVGYASLTELHPPGVVSRTRDPTVPFRFVESVYSIGQWVSPHRLREIDQLTWRPDYNAATGLYRCVNAYQPPVIETHNPVPFID